VSTVRVARPPVRSRCRLRRSSPNPRGSVTQRASAPQCSPCRRSVWSPFPTSASAARASLIVKVRQTSGHLDRLPLSLASGRPRQGWASAAAQPDQPDDHRSVDPVAATTTDTSGAAYALRGGDRAEAVLGEHRALPSRAVADHRDVPTGCGARCFGDADRGYRRVLSPGAATHRLTETSHISAGRRIC
jgi:hypothetical protein